MHWRRASGLNRYASRYCPLRCAVSGRRRNSGSLPAEPTLRRQRPYHQRPPATEGVNLTQAPPLAPGPFGVTANRVCDRLETRSEIRIVLGGSSRIATDEIASYR